MKIPSNLLPGSFLEARLGWLFVIIDRPFTNESDEPWHDTIKAEFRNFERENSQPLLSTPWEGHLSKLILDFGNGLPQLLKLILNLWNVLLPILAAKIFDLICKLDD